MRVTAVLLCSAVAVPAAAGWADAAPRWERIQTETGQRRFEAVAVHPTDPQRLFAATPRAVYESRDGGARWVERARLPGSATVRRLAVDAAEPPAVLAATADGLYGSFDGGARWSRVFRGAGEGEADCAHVAFHPARPGVAVLATRGGVWLSADRGARWQAVEVPGPARDAAHAAFDPHDPDRLYVVSAAGLVAGSLATGRWETLTGIVRAEDEEVEEPDVEPSQTEETGVLRRLSAVSADPQAAGALYLAGARGLERSQDGGRTWERVGPAGGAATVARLWLQSHSPTLIYAATDRGVSRYDPGSGRWEALSSGLGAARVQDLAGGPRGVFAATDDGLYRFEVEPEAFGESEPPSARELLANFAHEPTIGQVREAAIRYAEVHPEKIRRWRRQAALQALLPSVDIGWDRDRSRDARYDEGAFPNFQVVETEDRNAGFDVSVSWDLGELIWNDDQTTIDVRSKLMVQLRDDLVDDATRTYYERRRLQVLLLTGPPPGQPAPLEQELRLQELTARLDGLTGGYFSSQMDAGDVGRR
jgi:photosystem II stability/assembly factor-like uncharacterized protein